MWPWDQLFRLPDPPPSGSLRGRPEGSQVMASLAVEKVCDFPYCSGVCAAACAFLLQGAGVDVGRVSQLCVVKEYFFY